MAPTSFSKAEGEYKDDACWLEGKDAPTEKKKKKVWCKIKPKPNSISIVGAVAYCKEEE